MGETLPSHSPDVLFAPTRSARTSVQDPISMSNAPEHRIRSRYGNTHSDPNIGCRRPTTTQCNFMHGVEVDLWGYTNPGTAHRQYAAHYTKIGRPSSEGGNMSMSPKRATLMMKYNLRAATPNYPYDPYSMEPSPQRIAGSRPYRVGRAPVPEQIERNCQMTAVEIANEHKSKGGIWNPTAYGREVPRHWNTHNSWKIPSRIGPIGEPANSIPGLRGCHHKTPYPVLGESLRD